jgi:hypothetical protein
MSPNEWHRVKCVLAEALALPADERLAWVREIEGLQPSLIREVERLLAQELVAEAIMENRRRRLGSDYEPIEYPPDWFASCRGAADHNLTRSPILAGTRGSQSRGQSGTTK